jgi:thiol-disulfide isomerase/thioredoxin
VPPVRNPYGNALNPGWSFDKYHLASSTSVISPPVGTGYILKICATCFRSEPKKVAAHGEKWKGKKMNAKLLFATLSAALFTMVQASAQTAATNGLAIEFKALMTKTTADIKAGKRTEDALADDIKQFDSLLAEHQGEKTDEVARVLWMKAMLYSQVIGNTDKSDELIKQLKSEFQGTQLVAKLEKQEADAAAAKNVQDSLVKGAMFPDFAEKDLNGAPISVADYKGKVVLVDFWATWCGPCRGELPNVIATYKKHHANGFEIIGVSLDSERDKLDAFLKNEDGMTWPQFFDGQGWQNKLAVKYGVESIPFAVLIGPEGKIIGKDLRGDDLENAVASALTK